MDMLRSGSSGSKSVLKSTERVAPTNRYVNQWLDCYYDQAHHDKAMKPKMDLIVRNLYRPHMAGSSEMTSDRNLELYR